jgi:hypothetical protein
VNVQVALHVSKRNWQKDNHSFLRVFSANFLVKKDDEKSLNKQLFRLFVYLFFVMSFIATWISSTMKINTRYKYYLLQIFLSLRS